MSEMVKRVAEALAHHTFRRDDYVHDSQNERCSCRECKAKAVIAAMRDMIDEALR